MVHMVGTSTGAVQIMAAKKKPSVEAAATKLAEMTQTYLARLSPAERRARLRAFRKVISGIPGPRAKSVGSPRTPATPLAARGRAGH